MKGKLIASDPERTAGEQIKTPCSDCPWRRDALNGWLGGNTSHEWIVFAHGDVKIDCHVYADVQCAGAAIYRANVAKSPRDKSLLVLPADPHLVFTTPGEFVKHHECTPERRLLDKQRERRGR